jgi:hypothetical protein
MRAHSLVLQALGRIVLLLLWCLAGWGTLLLVSALASAVAQGPAPAVARLLPAPGASIWGWLSSLSVLLALGAGLTFVAFAIAKRWQGGTSRDE